MEIEIRKFQEFPGFPWPVRTRTNPVPVQKHPQRKYWKILQAKAAGTAFSRHYRRHLKD